MKLWEGPPDDGWQVCRPNATGARRPGEPEPEPARYDWLWVGAAGLLVVLALVGALAVLGWVV